VVLRRRADRAFEHLGPPLCSALDGEQQQQRPDVGSCFRFLEQCGRPHIHCTGRLAQHRYCCPHPPTHPHPFPHTSVLIIRSGLPLTGFPGYVVRVKYATEHRCGVAVSGPGLSDAVSGTDPLKDALPLLTCQPTDESPEVSGWWAKCTPA
jgi:hypothetical protein